MASKVVRDEAARLVREHGAEAYQIARDAMRLARRRSNARLSNYFGKVALEVARQQKREVDVDTATRYLDRQN